MPSEPAPDTPLRITRDGESGVVTLTLNRPDQLNAISIGLLDALARELEAVSRDASCRVVVLAGAGRAFSAGHDLKELQETATGGQEAVKQVFDRCAGVMLAIARLPQPVIARVHGIAAAAGCQLVAACDLAVAADDARFATSGVKLGLFCSTPTVELSRDIGRKKALEMLLTGDFISAAEARDLGLVNRVVAVAGLDAAVMELAAKIADKPPQAVRMGKQLFYRQLEAGIDQAYALATEAMACNLLGADAQAGIDAFLHKKPMPEWPSGKKK